MNQKNQIKKQNRSSQFKEAWLSKSLGYLELVDKSNGNWVTFEVSRKQNEPRLKTGDMDTNLYFGGNGFQRMRSLENISCEMWETDQDQQIRQIIYDCSFEELQEIEETIKRRKQELREVEN